jgi:hypothetical protein
MITFTTASIPGLKKLVRSDRSPVWVLTIEFQGRRQTHRHNSLEEAINRYRLEKLRQAFLQWPPFTAAEHRALLATQHKHAVLIPVLEPMLQAALAAHEATEERPRNLRPACHQNGLPANQDQKGTGGQVESDILFHAYARRWFETSKAGWSQSTQDATRSLCTQHLNPAFGSHRLRDITVEWVERWLQKQLKTYSLSLCQNMRKTLASIFYAAKADGLVTANPVTDPRCMLPTHTTRQRLTSSI